MLHGILPIRLLNMFSQKLKIFSFSSLIHELSNKKKLKKLKKLLNPYLNYWNQKNQQYNHRNCI